MACFIVPVAEAIVTTVITKAVKSKEIKSKESKSDILNADNGNDGFGKYGRIPFSRKLRWLNNMLWGGSALLAFEHLWHGEIVPWYPFLTAASSPAGMSVALSEMATVGVAMAIFITAIWCVMLLVTGAADKKALNAKTVSN